MPVVVLLAAASLLPAQEPAPAVPPPVPAEAQKRTADAAIEPFRRELLELAFAAASAFPLPVHGKNRSRAQDEIVVACFELDQPNLALAFGSKIADWRRGCAYADYAWHAAKRGDADGARPYIELAERVIADEAENETSQEWRRDLIAMKIARAQGALGDDAAAAKAVAGVDASSATAVDQAWASAVAARVDRIPPEKAADELAAMDRQFPTMSLAEQNIALAMLAGLHERFFADKDVRSGCEKRLAETFASVPPQLRLDALARVVRTSLAHGDRDGGKKLIASMRGIVEGHTWRSEDRMPEIARVIELTYGAGDRDRARTEAEEALADYHRERESIVNIYRAETLRPLALAWFVLEEPAKGEELLALVIEEGMENPNSRPRCDDFVATCVALAKRGIRPPAATMTRMQEVYKGLGEPW